MKKILITSFLILISTLSACAEPKWIFTNAANTQYGGSSKYYLDTGSIKHQGNTAYFYLLNKYDNVIDYDIIKLAYHIYYVRLNCSNHDFKFLKVSAYAPSNQLINTMSGEVIQSYVDISNKQLINKSIISRVCK